MKLIEAINEVNDGDVETKESAVSKVVAKETLTPIPQNSLFVFYKDFYPTPRITLLDAELSNESKHQLNNLLGEFSDVMSKNSKNIGLTHLEEMLLPTEPGAAPVSSKPYDLPLKHHKFVKEELTNLLEARPYWKVPKPLCSPNYSSTLKAPPGSFVTKKIGYWLSWTQ